MDIYSIPPNLLIFKATLLPIRLHVVLMTYAVLDETASSLDVILSPGPPVNRNWS